MIAPRTVLFLLLVLALTGCPACENPDDDSSEAGDDDTTGIPDDDDTAGDDDTGSTGTDADGDDGDPDVHADNGC